MILKLFYYFLIVLLLQSCSGGRIGNFLELSFSNLEEEESKSIKNNSYREKFKINKNTLKDSNKLVVSKNENFSELTNKKSVQKRQNLKFDENNNRPKIVIKKDIIQDQNKKIKRNYDLQSYRFIIILKAVDPTAPAQKFSNVLKNANILFEIEKIERFQENDFKKLK